MKQIIILLFVVISCKPNTERQVVKYDEFEFAITNDEPVFEDEFLYNKQAKKCLIEEVNEIEIYYFDWNNNGKFKESGIDYIGVKSKLETKPTITKINNVNSIKINGISHRLNIQDRIAQLVQTSAIVETELSLINELTPIILESGEKYYPELTSDSTVIYFWATWCRPCIETLKSIDVEKLNHSGINLIPIAYNCTGSKEFLEKNNLNFKDLIISENSAYMYNIKSLSKQYTFLRNRKVS